MLTRAELMRRIDGIRQANLRHGARAPHKPLLLLYLLACLQRRAPGDLRPLRVAYSDVDPVVSPLIGEFGPPAHGKHRAALPFYHLDPGLWRLDRRGLAPRHTVLCDRRAVGELDPAVLATLVGDPALLVDLAWRLLRANFPDTYIDPICAALGLELGPVPLAPPHCAPADPPRAPPQFRADVLRAYDHACAFCGYAGMTSTAGVTLAPVGLAAAHVHWRAAGGPDHVTNGLALCDLHHTLFDRGILGVDDRRAILVSPRFTARDDRALALVRDLHLRPPRTPLHAVTDAHFAWHRTQVFRSA